MSIEAYSEYIKQDLNILGKYKYVQFDVELHNMAMEIGHNIILHPYSLIRPGDKMTVTVDNGQLNLDYGDGYVIESPKPLHDTVIEYIRIRNVSDTAGWLILSNFKVDQKVE